MNKKLGKQKQNHQKKKKKVSYGGSRSLDLNV